MMIAHTGLRAGLVFFFLWTLFPGHGAAAWAAPEADLWPKWQAHDPNSPVAVDHSSWHQFLRSYLVTDHPSGVNRVRYGSVSPADRETLERYLTRLQKIPVSALSREVQKAFWINLYNALTVKVILDHYPVDTIRDIDISPGWFSSGPWGAKLLTIEGQEVGLDDIEHRILRPIWRDNRIHYAVNCASIGCPNLQPEPFTRENSDRLLRKGAHEYVNHPRGVSIQGNRLILSSIYDWFQIDFGGSRAGVLEHLAAHADPSLSRRLRGFEGGVDYRYDWSLNEP